MISAMLPKSPGAPKALVCKAFMEYCKKIRRLLVWHDSWHFGIVNLPPICTLTTDFQKSIF